MIILRIVAGGGAEAVLTQVKLLATRFPGEHELRLDVRFSDAHGRTLTLGPARRYAASEPCLAALREFGAVEVTLG
jgi:hypothetical protein